MLPKLLILNAAPGRSGLNTLRAASAPKSETASVAILTRKRLTRVVLAAAHRDHDTSNNADANLAAFCQRCHMIHDRPEHQRRRWRTLFRRKALGDLFGGPYA